MSVSVNMLFFMFFDCLTTSHAGISLALPRTMRAEVLAPPQLTEEMSAADLLAEDEDGGSDDPGGDGAEDLANSNIVPNMTAGGSADNESDHETAPHLVRLRRESVPIYRRGKIASFKTSYSGVLRVGTPAQEFRVVFDTGSGNVVIPSISCQSEACLVHRQYNVADSTSAKQVHADGSELSDGELGEQVTIGFGTGEITGDFVRDTICIVSGDTSTVKEPERPCGANSVTNEAEINETQEGPCLEMNVIVAFEMSAQPFKTFHFDGILGLGLDPLAMNEEFSTFALLSKQMAVPRFGAFLTEGENGEESEMSFGGHNPARLLEPLQWAPVALKELGYWQIEILAVRINGIELDVCRDGECRGVVDTGTSHLGVPAPFDAAFGQLLTTPAGDMLDCRLVDAPEVEFELRGFNITLQPANYMRRLPLRPDVQVGSIKGVHLQDDNASKDGNAGSEVATAPSTTPATPPPSESVQVSATAELRGSATMRQSSAVTGATTTVVSSDGSSEELVERLCRPRMMPVRLPAPLGPKLFILGEPVLHRYYTVYDWKAASVGFGLANNRRNTLPADYGSDGRGVLPSEVDKLLMQKSMTTTLRVAAPPEAAAGDDEVLMMQMHLTVSVVSRWRVQ